MEPKRETLAITVDKSHLITIGEKLYTQSIEQMFMMPLNSAEGYATPWLIRILKLSKQPLFPQHGHTYQSRT
ncbi:MAG TPA: hypothetical protein DCR39_00925 [Nitrospiraceae bacterium]|nr:hypothetical protein [Nitrospiraceae bacterium]